MEMAVEKRSLDELTPLHELFREAAQCQIVRDSFWARGFLDAYGLRVDGRLAAYGAVTNRYDTGRVIEFYVLPEYRGYTARLFGTLLAATRAPHIEAQTNMPGMLLALYDFAAEIKAEKVLFADGEMTRLACPPGATVRRKKKAEERPVFGHEHEPEGEWEVEAGGEIVATGGYLSHYNPPYSDLYMEVAEPQRRRGFGSYLIQELKRICYENGKKPAARCDVNNVASRRTLEKAGLLACGHLLVGAVK